MRKVPFCWVVKLGPQYLTPMGTYLPKQRFAWRFTARWRAQKWAAARRGRVVMLWSKLPKPKLPDWLVPCDRRDTISVFRPPTPTCRRWDEWVFEVGYDQNPLVSLFMLYQHWSAECKMEGRFDGAPADVFEEAIQRARALRRAENRARKEGR